MNIQKLNRILVIDDERSVRENIAAYLEDSDFTVFLAENGREGLEIYEEVNPDVVLVDIDMPEINGLEVLTEIKKVSDETPVIIVSGAGEVKYAIEASRLGAWDFVLKPIYNMSVVEHTIYKVLEHRKLLRENREYKENLEKNVKERTISLVKRTTELQQTNEKLIAEIEERKLVEAQLRQAMERSVALRRFSSQISTFNDEARLLTIALDVLCKNIYSSGATLFHEFRSNRFTQYLAGNPNCSFLNKLPTFEFLQNVFNKRSQEIVVYNTVSETCAIYDFYTGMVDGSEDILGGHFVFFRGKTLHQHLFCFYRDALYTPFNSLDIEYLKSMISEINIAYESIQIMRVNTWLERRLKSVIHENWSNLLAETHSIDGFDITTSVYPSYQIKAECHKMIPINEQMVALLISDIPGEGLSDVMYNEMVGELLADNLPVLTDPEKVMSLLNEQLQTDFHPNRYLTLNYFLICQTESSINYSNLGHESMTLIKFDKNSHVTLMPKKSPFVQVQLNQVSDFFHQESILLGLGEMLFGFSQRMNEMIDAGDKGITVDHLLEVVRHSFELTTAGIMEEVIHYLIDFFPKELLQDDVNLIMIRHV